MTAPDDGLGPIRDDFLSGLRERLEALQSSPDARRLAHNLAGSAAMLGFDSLGALARTLESALSGGSDPAEAREALRSEALRLLSAADPGASPPVASASDPA